MGLCAVKGAWSDFENSEIANLLWSNFVYAINPINLLQEAYNEIKKPFVYVNEHPEIALLIVAIPSEAAIAIIAGPKGRSIGHRNGLTRLRKNISAEDISALRNVYRQAKGEIPISDLYKPVSQGGAVRKISGTGQATKTLVYKFNRTGNKVQVEIYEVPHAGGDTIKILNETIPAHQSPLPLKPGENFTHALAQP